MVQPKWVTADDPISSLNLCSDTFPMLCAVQKCYTRHVALQAQMLSIPFYAWTFNLVEWVMEHGCQYTKAVGWLI